MRSPNASSLNVSYNSGPRGAGPPNDRYITSMRENYVRPETGFQIAAVSLTYRQLEPCYPPPLMLPTSLCPPHIGLENPAQHPPRNGTNTKQLKSVNEILRRILTEAFNGALPIPFPNPPSWTSAGGMWEITLLKEANDILLSIIIYYMWQGAARVHTSGN